MTEQPPIAPDEPAPAPVTSPAPPGTKPPMRRNRIPWIAGSVAALVLLGAGAAVAYSVLKEDPGIAACKAIRDQQGEGGGDNDDMTEPEYRETRKLFADSDHEDIRNHGTRLVDLVWQMQQLPEGDEVGGFAYIGQLAEHATGLQSACADQGIMFNLLDGAEAGGDPIAGAGETVEPGASSPGPIRTEGSAATEEGRSFAWPDGVSVRLDKVETVDRDLGESVPKSRSLVRVFLTFRNTTTTPVPVDEYASFMTVLYGPNHTESDEEVGFGSDDPAKQLFNQDTPTRIAAGGELKLWRTWSVPTKELGQLAVKVEPPQVPGSMGIPAPYTFVDVEKMLITK